MSNRLSCSLFSSVITATTLLYAGLDVGESKADPPQTSVESVRSWPRDTTKYSRSLSPEEGRLREVSPLGASTELMDPQAVKGSHVFMVDVVVNNTDPNLTNTDVANDGETSIAVNPKNPKEIIISAFSGSWGAAAPIYHTLDGGSTWTREFSVPIPPGWNTGCPCDWTFDYGRNDELSAAILASTTARGGVDIVSGTTTNPAQVASFAYFDPPGPPVQAQETNINVPTSLGHADQPWLLVNRHPSRWWQDNVYVGWDDFANSDGVDGPDMRVAVSYGFNPPDFTQDQQVGNSLGAVNPGLRLVKYRTGTMWALWGRNVAPGAGGSKNIDYMLNRSTDGGNSWSLNGAALGIRIANADSTQPQPKFGTVNALLGNVDHAAVDPWKGGLYYVYGNRDSATGNNRLAIRRIVTDPGSGNVTIGAEHFVTGQVQAAIPQVAVNIFGHVGVFYYTFDGFSSTAFPTFTAHLAVSRNGGVTFTDRNLVTFLSVARDNGDSRQRVLGDYMQMKALGGCFYGSFTANGAAFGRPFANHDPIFFKACLL